MEFQIKAYKKADLAMMYFEDSKPHTAVNHLMSWININSGLLERLAETGYTKTQKVFSPRQVELIADAIGAPGEYE